MHFCLYAYVFIKDVTLAASVRGMAWFFADIPTRSKNGMARWQQA